MLCVTCYGYNSSSITMGDGRAWLVRPTRYLRINVMNIVVVINMIGLVFTLHGPNVEKTFFVHYKC